INIDPLTLRAFFFEYLTQVNGLADMPRWYQRQHVPEQGPAIVNSTPGWRRGMRPGPSGKTASWFWRRENSVPTKKPKPGSNIISSNCRRNHP
ncbi:MAG: hypothetical protein ACK57U_07670, partial [Planctomycetota bacterium]